MNKVKCDLVRVHGGQAGKRICGVCACPLIPLLLAACRKSEDCVRMMRGKVWGLTPMGFVKLSGWTAMHHSLHTSPNLHNLATPHEADMAPPELLGAI